VRAAGQKDPVTVISPCLSVCRMDEAGLCEGCFRTLDEIAAWSGLDGVERLAVWERIEKRAQAQ
jgi:hypothetical protein